MYNISIISFGGVEKCSRKNSVIFYEENGYIGVEAVLTAEEVADLQRNH